MSKEELASIRMRHHNIDHYTCWYILLAYNNTNYQKLLSLDISLYSISRCTAASFCHDSLLNIKNMHTSTCNCPLCYGLSNIKSQTTPHLSACVANARLLYICRGLFVAFRSLRTCTKWHSDNWGCHGNTWDHALITCFGMAWCLAPSC